MHPKREPSFPASMHFSRGSRELHLQQYAKAVESFTAALARRPDHPKTLLNRCRSHLGLLQMTNAKADAEAALAKWPLCAEAHDLKAKAQYRTGDIEAAWQTYIEARREMPHSRRLVLGQSLCEETLDYAKGQRGVGVDDLKRLRTGEVVRKPRFKHFRKDKEVLEDLLADKGVKVVHGLCREGLEVIRNNRMVGAMQLPIFGRRGRAPSVRRQVARQEGLVQYARRLLRRCEDYLDKDKPGMCLSEGSRLLDFVEHRVTSAEKDQLEADIFHVLAMAHERQNRGPRCISFLEAGLGAAQDAGSTAKELRELHCLGRRYLARGMVARGVMCARRVLARVDKREEVPSLVVGEAAAWARGVKARIRRSIREVLKTAEQIVRRSVETMENWCINEVLGLISSGSESVNTEMSCTATVDTDDLEEWRNV